MKKILLTFIFLFFSFPVLAESLAGGFPALNVIEQPNGGTTYSLSLQILALMTALTVLPSLVLGMTSFTRIIIVLSGAIGNLAQQNADRFYKALKGWGWPRPKLSTNDLAEEVPRLVEYLHSWEQDDLDITEKQTTLIVSWKNPTRIRSFYR